MKTQREKLENTCKHFTGISNIECEAGVKYESVKDKSSKPYRWPCLKGNIFSGGICNKLCMKTEEEVDAEIEELNKECAKALIVYAAIKKHVKTTGINQGEIECPSCGGKLNYVSATLNGHIHAKCKCGINIME